MSHPEQPANTKRVRRRRGFAIFWTLLGLLCVGHVANAHTTRLDAPARESAHVRQLSRAIEMGAGARMQLLFPEGEFFTIALTGLAAGRLAEAGVDVEANRQVVNDALRRLDAPHVAEIFGGHATLEHGAFFRGWRLLLIVQQAKFDQAARVRMVDEASQIMAALAANPVGVVTSYPGQAWPCDLIVAGAAVAQANQVSPVPGYQTAMEAWLPKIERWRDPKTGLIGHQVDIKSGKASAARGTSQVIINTFLPDISTDLAQREYALFRETFVDRTYGLVGVREHPKGVRKSGDVDSGPLIGGMSMSASAVGLGAARRNGDVELVRELNRESRLLGLELPALGKGGPGLAFAFGLMPVGDAFVIAARTEPPAPASSTLQELPGARWPLFYLVAVLPWLIALPLWASSRAGRRGRI